MKILYCITQGEQGGAQKHVFDLVNGMRSMGHEVFVAVGRIENEGDKWLRADFEIKNLQREVNIVKAIKAYFEIQKLIKKVNPDIVHLHSAMAGMVGSVAAKLAGKKVVYTVHGFAFSENINIFKKIFYILSEFLASFFRDFTILVSQITVDAGRKFFILRKHPRPLFQKEGSSANFKLIYNGVDEEKSDEIYTKEFSRNFIFEKIRNLYSSLGEGGGLAMEGVKDEGQKVIGTIANFYKTKGLEYFIDAATIINKSWSKAATLLKGVDTKAIAEGTGDFLFVVFGFGDESYRQELQNRINKHGLQNNFFLLGKTPDAFKYLKGLDLFVLSSVKEGLPYSLLEANMANIPIVATAVGGISEMARHIKINLIESKNSKDLANSISKILGEQKLQGSTLRQEFPEIFKLENMIKETLEVYKKMIPYS